MFKLRGMKIMAILLKNNSFALKSKPTIMSYIMRAANFLGPSKLQQMIFFFLYLFYPLGKNKA